MSVESYTPIRQSEELERSNYPILTTVDRVYSPPLKDNEWLTLGTAPLALFNSPGENGKRNYTALFDYELGQVRLLRFLRSLAPQPGQNLDGARGDWARLYKGDYVTKDTIEFGNAEERARLIQLHSKFLPPAWKQFMKHHAAQFLDASIDYRGIGKNPFVAGYHIDHYLSNNQEEHMKNLRKYGLVDLSFSKVPKTYTVNWKNRLMFRQRYNFGYDHKAYSKGWPTIVADTLSLLPVLQWTTEENGNREINVGPIHEDPATEWGQKRLVSGKGWKVKQLDNPVDRLNTALGVGCLAYFTEDIRLRERWKPQAVLDPNKGLRNVSEAQVPIRILEEDFSQHPFLDSAEQYMAQNPNTFNDKMAKALSRVKHSVRAPINNAMLDMSGDIFV